MQTLNTRIAAQNKLLAPYAVPHEGRHDRMYDERGSATRTTFQRDRDRIIHCQAFRRLQGKTQVFVAGEGDHFRSRLTHTMEVAQISRDIARTMQLNEDLAECIALAHDLGHPPFGHSGEAALDEWMRGHKLHFEHNEQSYRIVTMLEEHSSCYKGLNLNREVLAGLLKHSTPHDAPASTYHLPSLEAQIVNLADEIAYTGHDCDDALQAKLFRIDDLTDVSLARHARERASVRDTSLRGALIHFLITDLYQESERRIADRQIKTLESVEHCSETLIAFSAGMQRELGGLRAFLWEHMYQHPKVLEKAAEGKETVTALCNQYAEKPPEKVKRLQERTNGTLIEAVKDYVAGMTDIYARAQVK